MMAIRPEQYRAFESDLAERRRDSLCDTIVDLHADTIVRLPQKTCRLAELAREEQRALTDASLGLALKLGFDRAEDQSAFVAIRFAAAPNFHEHPTIATILSQPRNSSARMKAIWRYSSEPDWEEIVRQYDPASWLRPTTRGSHGE